jgi:catechol 2,3-dioxygenase-like lactoylglutathione lyase family enzyme
MWAVPNWGTLHTSAIVGVDRHPGVGGKVMGNIKKIGTHIKVSNFAESRAFYLALGFQPLYEYAPTREVTATSGPEEGSLIIFATEDGTALLEIGDSHPAIKPEVFKERVLSSKVSLMVHVETLEEIIERAEKAKIAIAKAPVNFEWGTTELVIQDPDGFVVVFITQTTEAYKKLYPTI